MIELNNQIGPPPFVPEKLLTPGEVADRLQVSVAWVQAHASGRKLPQLPCRRLGKLIRFREVDIQQFLEQQAVAAIPQKPQRFKIM